MSWSEGDVWSATVTLPAGAAVEYKFVQQRPGAPPVWESCMNRTLTVDPAAADLTCAWVRACASRWMWWWCCWVAEDGRWWRWW